MLQRNFTGAQTYDRGIRSPAVLRASEYPNGLRPSLAGLPLPPPFPSAAYPTPFPTHSLVSPRPLQAQPAYQYAQPQVYFQTINPSHYSDYPLVDLPAIAPHMLSQLPAQTHCLAPLPPQSAAQFGNWQQLPVPYPLPSPPSSSPLPTGRSASERPTSQTTREQRLEKLKDQNALANSVIIFANGAIQIGVIATGAIAGLGSSGTVPLVTGAILAVLLGGRVSLYCVEIAEKVIKQIHKITPSHHPENAKEYNHIVESLDVVNRLLKGIIQSGQFITSSVAGYLNTTNWVARYVTAPILSSMAILEIIVLSEEIILNSYEVINHKFKIPISIERFNSIVRGIIQIIAISSLAAAAWVAQTQIVRIIGYLRTGLVACRVTTFISEIGLILLYEYKKFRTMEDTSTDALPEGMV